jgi:hypothetical protein
MFIVCGCKDKRRNVVGLVRFEDLKSIQPWHLHVEEEQVRPVFLHRFECLGPIGTFSDDLHAGLIGEQRTDSLACERFVIRNNCA